MSGAPPVIDISLSAADSSAAILAALHTHGFLCIKGHGIPQSQIDSVFGMSANFFATDAAHKLNWAYDGATNTGYVEMNRERLDPTKDISDSKEAFNVAKFIPSSPSNNSLPPELDEITLAEFSNAVHSVLMHVLAKISTALGLHEDYLSSRHPYSTPSGDILRLLCYNPAESGKVRAGAHTDYGSLTALFQKDVGGLQILVDDDTTWVDAPPVEGAIIINAGDLLEFWTGGYVRSTVHRVVGLGDSSGPRLSMAYFLHPDDNTKLSVIPSELLLAREPVTERRGSGQVFSGPGNNSSSSITAREHLEERLKRSYG